MIKISATKETLSIINELIETCKDSEKGYRLASNLFEDTEFFEIFEKYAEQRKRFVTELQEEANLFAGNHEHSWSISTSLQRGWINIKSIIAGDSIAEAINECINSEETAIENYKNALRMDLPPTLKSLVRHQYEEIKKAHDHMTLLKKGLS